MRQFFQQQYECVFGAKTKAINFIKEPRRWIYRLPKTTSFLERVTPSHVYGVNEFPNLSNTILLDMMWIVDHNIYKIFPIKNRSYFKLYFLSLVKVQFSPLSFDCFNLVL